MVLNKVNHRSDGTTEIQLTQGKTAIIDTNAYPLVAAYRWHAQQYRKDLWYAASRLCGLMHNLIRPGLRGRLDHKDGNGLNNRRQNLRPASKSQNRFNSRKQEGSSQFRGVSWHKSTHRWRAYIHVDGRHIHLGTALSEYGAWKKREIAEQRYYSGFEHGNKVNFAAKGIH
jgi:hypothetical protein